MGLMMIFVVVFLLLMGVLLFEMLRTPAGVERESRIEQHRIFSKTRTVAKASLEEAVRALQSDWSWWSKARAGKMKDLGNGLKEFVFQPISFFNFITMPTAMLVRFERVESLPDGGKRIHATLTGDFDGRAEYTARPGPGGTAVELAWCGTEVRGALRFMPVALVAAVHCWRERLGVEGLRDRLQSGAGAK